MPQAERERVGAGHFCQFVHRGLDRKHIPVGTERTQRGGSEPAGCVDLDAHILEWQIIDRDRVAGGTASGRLAQILDAVGQPRRIERLGRCQIDEAAKAGPL